MGQTTSFLAGVDYPYDGRNLQQDPRYYQQPPYGASGYYPQAAPMYDVMPPTQSKYLQSNQTMPPTTYTSANLMEQIPAANSYATTSNLTSTSLSPISAATPAYAPYTSTRGLSSSPIASRTIMPSISTGGYPPYNSLIGSRPVSSFSNLGRSNSMSNITSLRSPLLRSNSMPSIRPSSLISSSSLSPTAMRDYTFPQSSYKKSLDSVYARPLNSDLIDSKRFPRSSSYLSSPMKSGLATSGGLSRMSTGERVVLERNVTRAELKMTGSLDDSGLGSGLGSTLGNTLGTTRPLGPITSYDRGYSSSYTLPSSSKMLSSTSYSLPKTSMDLGSTAPLTSSVLPSVRSLAVRSSPLGSQRVLESGTSSLRAGGLSSSYSGGISPYAGGISSSYSIGRPLSTSSSRPVAVI